MPSSMNVLIGVGGTGAKVVEAATVAFWAGAGPRDVSLAFVDQDGGNGNVARSIALLRAAERFRSLWWNESRADSLSARDANGTLGSAVIRSLTPADPLWTPHAADATLAEILHADAVQREDPQLRALMDSLFTPGPREQGMALTVGYRGHAHIGSAAFLSGLKDDQPFWSALMELLQRARGGQEVRIFLAGSVFGGTGAAGFPTLARKLRQLAQAADGAKIRLGGALMLPYFGFNRPDDPGANVARQEELLLQSEEALRYYGDLFEREGAVFDELYLTGWSPLFQLGYHSPGSASQANPPLPPELLAATGAARFFLNEGDSPADRRVFLSSRADAEALGWGDIPKPDEDRDHDPYRRIGQLLRFCSAWRNTVRPALKKTLFGGDAWFRRQGANKVRYDNPETIENLGSIDDMVERVLQWAAATQLFATTAQFGPPGVRRFGLWDVSLQAVFPDTMNPEAVSAPIRLRAPLSGAAAVAAFERAAGPADGKRPTQADLFELINTRTSPIERKGLGRIVDAVFEASAVEPVGVSA